MAHRPVNQESKRKQETKRPGARQEKGASGGRMASHDAANVQRFLDRFAKAMTSGDTKAVAELWEAPAFVIDEQATIPVSSLADVERFFAGSKDQYNERGITTTKAEILDLDWVSDNLVVARVRWPYLDDAGKTLGAESSSYTLKRNGDGDFKLRVVLMRGVEDPGSAKKHAKN
jgi:hypothetical protein